ncbi:MAG: hypothetical protein QG592_1097 [Pseudomonadota bacterium]|nr:hypothetical protein [Pseudomonadota bacterium]
MSDLHHERHLEKEMLEAAQHVADVSHVETDPLLIILWRLNHQDRTLDAIKGDLHAVGETLNDHIAREDTIKESIDEMVSMWKGSKLVGKIITWLVGVIAAIGAAWATAKKSLL